MFGYSALIDTLRATIARLEDQLEQERSERRHLLDCLLRKHNAEPLAETPAAQGIGTSSPMVVISPFGGGATPEVTDALKESWIAEEAQYLMLEQGMAEDQARLTATRRFATEHGLSVPS